MGLSVGREPTVRHQSPPGVRRASLLGWPEVRACAGAEGNPGRTRYWEPKQDEGATAWEGTLGCGGGGGPG